MIPLKDDVPIRHVAWVNGTLILLNVAVFLYEVSLGSRVEAVLFTWGVLPSEFFRWWEHGLDPLAHAPRTLLTAQFVHAGLLHLAGNLLFLWIFGDNVEDRFGHAGYLLFYLLAGVAAILVQVLAEGPRSSVPLVGASGAIAGVLGAYLKLYPRSRVSVLLVVIVFITVVRVPALAVLGLWFLFQLLHGVASLRGTSPGLDTTGWWAHIGGFGLGFGLAAVWPQVAPAAAYRPELLPSAGMVQPERRGAVRAIQVAGWLMAGLLAVRVLLILAHPIAPPLLNALLGLVVVLTDALTAPFTPYLRPVVFRGYVLDVAGLGALLAVRSLEFGLVWLIGSARRRAAG